MTAITVDNDGLTVQSEPLTIYVKDISTITRYEAEEASYSGTGPFNIRSTPLVSNAKYLEMQEAWTLTFNNIGVQKEGDYLLIIGYLLNFGSPKIQYLFVNGDSLGTVEFTAPNITTWLQHGVKIPLKTGTNEITIRGGWNWMSFDYIGIEGTKVVSAEDVTEIPQSFSLAQNYPNPFNPSTVITYTLPKSGNVKLEIYNIMGQRISTLVDEFEHSGIHKLQFDAQNIASGVYFYRIQINSTTITKSMVLLR